MTRKVGLKLLAIIKAGFSGDSQRFSYMLDGHGLTKIVAVVNGRRSTEVVDVTGINDTVAHQGHGAGIHDEVILALKNSVGTPVVDFELGIGEALPDFPPPHVRLMRLKVGNYRVECRS